jgi:4-hydroxy-4-methyl-2-oxoglutarate aldolase
MHSHAGFPRKEILMKKRLLIALAVSVVLCTINRPAFGQLGLFSKEQRIEITREWKGERFPDGRPKVPDAVLNELKGVDAEEAWLVLRDAGYHNQFEGGWKTINAGPRMVGRVVTAVYMPYRPDLNAFIQEKGKAEGRIGRDNSWIIDILQPGDILVVDLFGKIKSGTLIGDNLGTAIMTKSHTGLIVDGAVRDVTGLKKIKGLQVYARGFDPTGLANVVLTGINVPIRIGQVTVMPGDVAVSDPEGITFIPYQLCQKIADAAPLVHLQDEWGHMMLRQEKYTPGQIDGKWTPAMIEEFNDWAAKTKHSKIQMRLHH